MKWLTFVALSINLAPFFSSTCIVASSVGATTNSGTEGSSTPSASVSGTPTTTPTNSSVPTSSSASGSSAPAPTSTGVPDSDTLKDIQTIFERRLSSITGALTKAKDVASWLTTLGDDGKWPDSEVDYTTGCEARRANWPAQTHWQRISTMAGAWHGGLKGAESQYVKDPTLRADIAKAMQYWFSRDFVNNPACLDLGGEDACPCSNPENTLWNTNWFSNIILIPGFVGETCVLLNGTLSNSELEGCMRMTSRAYGTFGREINGLGTLTGANTLDVASIGIDLALITLNQTLIADAHSKVHAELVIEDAVHADGIRRDGAFGQHAGILYNGNYGKDYSNDILAIEIDAAGTQFQASDVSKSAFNTLFEGNSWMIYQNILTGVNHWDFSALGRFISFPVADNQATGSLKTNLTQVQELGKLWSSDILDNYATSLSKNWTSANAGNLQGNRMFYTNDYMVHRGPNYVTTVKMYSSRSQNTECVNNQNPFGFHLADGAVHTYIKGNEYEDIAAAWDWNLIPGTTTDYGATPLECNTTSQTGVESLVGGASDGKIGLAAMKFTNPITQFHFQKVWFFLEDDTHHVLISNVSPTLKTPVYSVLDQRLATGEVFVNGQTQNTASHARVKTLWHGDVGYTFPDFGTTVSAQVASKSGNWTAIGTSTRPPITVNLFSAYIEHNPFIRNVGYTVFPGSDQATFASKTNNLQLRTVRNDEHVAAVYDSKHKTAMAVFWDVKGGSATFIAGFGSHQAFTISADANVAVIYKPEDASLTVSDPSQTLNSVTIQVEAGWGYQMPGWGGSERGKVVTVQLPQGGLAGNSVTRSLRSRKGYHHKRRLAFH